MASSTLAIDDHLIDVPSGKVFARVWTPGDAASKIPIVLIHDSLGCIDLWRDFPSRLCEITERQVIAYDRLGFGRSEPRADQLSPSFVCDEAQIYLPCVLRQLHISRFIAFGHSVGGAMAICCGAALPKACAAIVTESAQMFAEHKTLQAIATARVEYAHSKRFARLCKYHGEKTAWVLNAWTDTWLSPEFASWSVEAELSQLQCPMLAIHGEQDEFGSLEHLSRARDLHGGAFTAKILQGCGHVPHKEQPELIVQLVAQFLMTALRPT